MKITIITACYNAAEHLPRTIDSVIAQDYSNVEYIIMDGASTDETANVLSRYRDQNIRIVSEPDEGLSDALNKGISFASGDVIGLLHAGDTYELTALSTAARFFQDNPDSDIVHGDIRYASVYGLVLYKQEPDFRKDVIWKKMPFHHPTCFVRRRSYEHYGVFDKTYKVAMDYELMLRFHCRGAKFTYIPQTLATMSLQGISDRNWRCSISESRRAAIVHGRNPMAAYITEWSRMLRTFATALFFRITGKTLRQSFPIFRQQTSPVRAFVGCMRRRFG
jgi:glycosyltransferase involved in cell wall biosynthesis